MTARGLIYGRLPIAARRGPYAGREMVYFDRHDIAAIGKLTTHGETGITRTMVRLKDGRELFVLVYQQAPDIRRVLRAMVDSVPTPIAKRDPGFAFQWTEIITNERQGS